MTRDEIKTIRAALLLIEDGTRIVREVLEANCEETFESCAHQWRVYERRPGGTESILIDRCILCGVERWANFFRQNLS